MRVVLACCGFLSLAAFCAAQDRDFLTPNEAEQVRETQDPNERLTLYVHFAKQRMDLLEQYVAKDKPGRSIFIHDTLEDYSHIIEAIDSVSDDALLHHKVIDKGLIAVLNAEKEFSEKLGKIQDANPRDLDRYQFVLQQAIDTTNDSHELSMEDSKQRGSALEAQDAKQKSDRESMMSQTEVKDRKKSAEAQDQPKNKVPSLYRPGEKPQTPQ
jgi:RNA binding exosome subunit